MVNNFELIKSLLTFNTKDEFYFVQVIQRKKDNPDCNYLGSNNSSRLIKAYYISSIEKLNKYEKEIIELCKLFNARAGINLNKRSFEKTAFNTMDYMIQQMKVGNWDSVLQAYNTACGVYNPTSDKVWLLDVDDIGRKANNIVNFIEKNCKPEGNKFINIIPSKTGYHIIMKPFDTKTFQEKYPDIEIHKNNPTNLYIP